MANTTSPLTHGNTTQEPAALRAELKEWERAFAAANGGRKAGREDIRKDEIIAAKYKAYSRLKSAPHAPTERTTKVKTKEPDLPPRPHEVQPPKHSSRKRRSSNIDESGDFSTPRKAPRQGFITPSKPPVQKAHPAEIDPYDSPSTLRKLFNPNNHLGEGYESSSPLPLRAAIGPTPQRDGKALGLFDLLSASGGSRAGETPSGRKSGIVHSGIAQTPSKKRSVPIANDIEEEATPRPRRQHSLTPVSSGKKFLYSNFIATPITLRYSTIAEEEGGNHGETNDTSKPSVSETPSFLRRSNPLRLSGLNNINEEDSTSPIAVRRPQKFMGKGLSALVQGLRDMEDERMDDDLAVLHEIEAEQMGNINNKVSVKDSQVLDNNDDEEPPEGTVAIEDQVPQQPRKQWKKKGQKRTTRRVNMKPNRAKPRPEPKWKSNVDDAEEESEDEDEDELVVPDTQIAVDGDDPDPDSDYGSLSGLGMSDFENDDDKDDDDDDQIDTARPKQKPRASTIDKQENSFMSKLKKLKPSKKKKDTVDHDDKENEKPKGRKVNPLAHANFRSLKIRNKGSKARGKGGRFGRR
ncbi:DNA replication regulator sld2 [Arachnomyces sp. PD_36]|nr:DNA replication regulator sld2 [Arachnomyces sp. PD_36]